MQKKRAFTMMLMTITVLITSCRKNDHNLPPVVHPNAAKYQRIIDKFMAAGAVGVSVTVISPDGTWNGTGGKADVQGNVAMTSDHRLRIGSMTKLFTMSTILKLQEEGVLNIKDKINKYIPRSITDHITNANDVTIEQCLNHTSGIREYLTKEVEDGIVNRTIVKFSAERNLQLIYHKPAALPVGQRVSYCNSNYLLLSAVINYATGKPAYQVVTEKIITPSHLQNTFASTQLPAMLTKSYFNGNENGGVMEDATYVDNNAVGGEGALDGGMISTAADVAKYLQALLTGKVLSAASVAIMETYHPIDPTDLSEDLLYYKEYGLGLMKLATDQGVALGHDGHVYGFVGKAYYLPAQKVTMVILLNCWSPQTVKVLNVKETFNLLF
jgi:D-alanyl-D-alanine carboxypeptidase